VVKWELVFSRHAEKDAKKLTAAGLKKKAEELLMILQIDPFQNPPPYEKLKGDFEGSCSRRINIQDRLVYQVIKKDRVIKVLRLWSHYD